MKRIFQFSLFMAGLILSADIRAQKVLPAFSVKELTRGKIQVSWINPYPDCIQIAVQRSGDSTRNFRTIFSSQSPELPSNGFVDTKTAAKLNWYYRIFYVLEGGNYYFSKIVSIETNPLTQAGVKPIILTDTVLPHEMLKNNEAANSEALHKNTGIVRIFLKKSEVYQLTRPEYIRFRDSINKKTKDALHKISNNAIEWLPAKITRIESDMISIYRNDSLVMQVENTFYKKFRDSMATKTSDTLFVVNNTRANIHAFIPKYVWGPSVYVYTNAQGYVTISLPLVKQHNYSIIFYEEDGSELFSIKNIKEPELILDKVNFFHAGWFRFELFEDNKLKEKHSFQLTKD
ncbi:MAG: hypothetical protein Q8K66_08785 [Sediminibacterium sp.]|nr:hypothetical protein [Sediminibacterium sp.]MDP3127246.1 hypothetical protein [Sediminibacterium sp.]